jgi:hypothetical protein
MRPMAWWARDWVVGFDGVEKALDPGKAVFDYGQQLFNEQGDDRRSRADAALFFYHGNSRQSLRGSGLLLSPFPNEDPPFRNVIQSCVDTKTAHIFREQVRCFALTSRGDSDLRARAEGITKAIEGAFTEAGIYDTKGFLVCQDGHLFEAGGIKLTIDFEGNRVLADRVFPWEVFVPEEEARSGNPRQMLHRQPVDRQLLIDMFPDHAELIKQAPACPDDWKFTSPVAHGETSDLVAVWEAWHLPSGTVDLDERRCFGINDAGEFDPNMDPGHDGRHVIAIENVTLQDRPWPYAYFPFAWYKPNPDPVGFWSRSIPESLAGVQLELIKLGRRIQNLIHFLAIPRLIAWRNAKINKNHLATNDYLAVIESSMPPQQSVWQATFPSVPSELFAREDALVDWAMKQVGISELSAFAQRPAGIDHAPGLQHLADTESIRHTPAFRAWREFHLQLGRLFVDAFRQLAEKNPDFEVFWGNAKDLKRIRWKDVEMERDKFQLRLNPTNMLPTTPGAKASRIVDFVNAGIFTAQQGLVAASEYPDIEALVGDASSVQRNIENKLADVLRNGLNEDNAPSAWMNPSECKRIAANMLNALEADGENPEKLEGIRHWWQMAKALEDKMLAEQAALQQQGMAGQPANVAQQAAPVEAAA